jgi:hypothetical protein
LPQRFGKEASQEFEVSYMNKLKERTKLLKDDIEYFEESSEIIHKNLWNQSAVVFEKSPRLKRLKEVLLAG